MTQVIEGHITPEDKANSDYYYVPFDVPPNTARIDVAYDYSHPRHHGDFEGQGNTIDIGIFDPHGVEFLKSDGFRGWSGSDRKTFFIAESEATPGYLAGPIAPGRWHVILGLYRVASEGCDFRVTIELTPKEKLQNPNFQLPTSNVRPADYRWYRGDLQAHTHHSDGKGSLATLIATAHARGLDFLAVTDHNTISHVREFAQHAPLSPMGRGDGGEGESPLLLIPAEEVTTYRGHMNVWGLREWLDFRCRDVETMQKIIAEAHRRGCLASVNHPKQGGPPWEYGSDLDFDCIEVWQAPWPHHNLESFSWWESLLQGERRIVAVGGSDYHQPAQVIQENPHLLGQPTTWVYAPALSVDAILDGIRRGHVCISADVNGPQLELRATNAAGSYMMGDAMPLTGDAQVEVQCHVRGAKGKCLRLIRDGWLADECEVQSDDWAYARLMALDQPGYIRAEVIEHVELFGAPDWVMLACTNPIYMRQAGR